LPSSPTARAAKPRSASLAASSLPPVPADVIRLHDAVLQSLDDDKAEEILSIPLAGKTAIADYMVIASGRSSRQVAAMAQHLQEKLRTPTRPVRIEGLTQGDWVLIDAGDVIVHLFRPEVRSFYNLEKMWSVEAPVNPRDVTPGDVKLAAAALA
jgi:ribosome-associated protein